MSASLSALALESAVGPVSLPPEVLAGDELLHAEVYSMDQLARHARQLAGWHRIHLPRVTLTLGFGDAAELLADVSAARAGGFPRAAVRSSGTVVLAWTEVGPGDPAETHVRVREWDPTQLSPAAGLLPALPRSTAPTTRELCPPTPAPKA